MMPDTTPPRIFVDLDGVLADFERGAREMLGIETGRSAPDPHNLWRAINRQGDFFRRLPLTPDAWLLWNGILVHDPHPTVLTGMPMVRGVEDQKRAWVRAYFGPAVPVICCLSRQKHREAAPGHILIDDWDKYAGLWTGAGGTFILHTSAQASLDALAVATGHPGEPDHPGVDGQSIS